MTGTHENDDGTRSRVPTVETVAIGTELAMGRVQDTNTHWMMGQIVALGGHLRRATIVEDDRAEIIGVIRDSVARGTNFVIAGGGLGPTPDDMTSECLAELCGTTLAVHEPTLDDYVVRRNLGSREDLTPNLVRMATVPATAKVLPNPAGWAPCIDMKLEDTRIFALAGPPHELQGVFTAHVAPAIAEASEIHRLAERVTVDGYESELSPFMQEVMGRFPGSYVKGYVAMRHDDGLPVDIVVSDVDKERAAGTLRAAIAAFDELLRENGKTLTRAK